MIELIIPALVVSFLWGLQPLIQKKVLKSINPQTSIVIGGVLYVICLLIYGLLNRKVIGEDLPKITRRHLNYIVFSTVICGFLTSIIYQKLIQNHRSYVVIALTYSAPVFTVLLTEYYLNESTTGLTKLAVFLITIGVVMLSIK